MILDIYSFGDEYGRDCFNDNCLTYSDELINVTDIQTEGRNETDGETLAICKAVLMAEKPVKRTATQEDFDDEYKNIMKIIKKEELLKMQSKVCKIGLLTTVTDAIKSQSDFPFAFNHLSKA